MSLHPELFPPIAPVAGTEPRPFWSVIVPAYKPDYLQQCLRSVMDQDPGAGAMEILVVDDASPHALEPIVRKVGGDRIRYNRNEKNLGTYGTENAGVVMSRGIWTYILNDDDWVSPGFFRTLHQGLANLPDNVGAACCLYTNVNSAGEPIWSPPPLQPTAGVLDRLAWIGTLCVRNPLNPVAVAIKRSTYERLGGYCLKFSYCGDWEFYQRAACHVDWYYEPTPLAVYRQHEQNESSKAFRSAMVFDEIAMAIGITHNFLPPEHRDQVTAVAREQNALYALQTAMTFLERGDLQAALSLIQSGVRLATTQLVADQLAALLTQPAAMQCRQALPQFSATLKFNP
ncbi:hypothetical protein BH10PLA1_BH10PLA1_19990 [soil metagenome]